MSVARFTLQLIGTFRLLRAGEPIDVNSRRAQALLAMLATSSSGERTRSWLQDRLWGSRGAEQAQASLRRELSSLRKIVNNGERELLRASGLKVWLDLDMLDIDLRQPELPPGEFLEGLDIPGEEGFEDWLREERSRSSQGRQPGTKHVEPVVPSPASTGAGARSGGTLTTLVCAPVAGAEAFCETLVQCLSGVRWIGLTTAERGAGSRFVITCRSHEGSASNMTLTLTDRPSGRLLWTGKAAPPKQSGAGLEPADFALAAIRARIAQAEQLSAMDDIDAQSDLASLVWRSQWHMHRMNRADAAKAREWSETALAAYPASREALIQSVFVRIWDLWVTRASDDTVLEMRQMAQQVIVADHEDARGHMLAGIGEIWLKQPLRAEVLLRRAVELDPSLIMARAQLSCALSSRLEVEEAEEQLDLALQLSPNDQYLFFIAGEKATVCLMQDKWDEALFHAESALASRRSYLHGYVAKINALVRLGRMAEARDAHAELYRVNPGYRPEFVDWIPFLDSSWNDFLKDGLNRAATSSD